MADTVEKITAKLGFHPAKEERPGKSLFDQAMKEEKEARQAKALETARGVVKKLVELGGQADKLDNEYNKARKKVDDEIEKLIKQIDGGLGDRPAPAAPVAAPADAAAPAADAPPAPAPQG